MTAALVPRPQRAAKTLVVDADYGLEPGAIAYNSDRPFKTLTAAKDAAVSGDLIVVRPGTFAVTTTLAKNGVRWHFQDGTFVDRSDAATGGIWDDLGVACTCTVTGKGTFTRSSSANLRDCVNVTHASSVFNIDALDIKQICSGISPGSAINQANGSLTIRCRDVLNTPGGPSQLGIFWNKGFMWVEGRFCRAQIWIGAQSPANGDAHLQFVDIDTGSANGAIYENSTDSNSAMWIHADTIRSSGTAFVIQKDGMGRLYVTCQKFFGIITSGQSEDTSSQAFGAGASAWNLPAGVRAGRFKVNGSSGGGGGSNATNGGGGGGGAARDSLLFTYGLPGTQVPVDIGALGAGGAANTDGGNGGDTNIANGKLIILGGRGGKSAANGGTGGAGGSGGNGNPGGDGQAASGATGGAGGVPDGGDGANATAGGGPGEAGVDGSALVEWISTGQTAGLFYLSADKGSGKITIKGRNNAWIRVNDFDGGGTYTPLLNVLSTAIDNAVPNTQRIVDVMGTTFRNTTKAVKLENCILRLRSVVMDVASQANGIPLEMTGGILEMENVDLVANSAEDGFKQSGGSARISRCRIDASLSSSKNPIQKLAGDLEVVDSTLIAHEDRNCIEASTSQVVTVRGTVETNRPKSTNVAIARAGVGLLSVLTPPQITADQNNYDPGRFAETLRLSSDASRNITGLLAGLEGQRIRIVNVGTQNIVLVHQSTSSTAANRFLSSTGANVTLAPNQIIWAEYDTDASVLRWRLG